MENITFNTLKREIRLLILDMINKSKASHIASAFSIVDLLVVLYMFYLGSPLKVLENKDSKFILSKGHAGVALYATLAKFGFFSLDKLNEYYSNGSNFSGHISSKGVPGVELSTGSLGHGAGYGAGIAYSYKLDKRDGTIYVLVGDGECNEGTIWEMAIFAGHHKLNNLVLIVDFNRQQALGLTKEILNLEPLKEKFQAFEWDVLSIDGHDFNEIKASLSTSQNKPLCIIANTIKGKGVSFMEDNLLWHYRDPQGEFYIKAKIELESN